MSKGKRKRKHTPAPGIGPSGQNEDAIRAELGGRVTEITQADPDQAGPIWGAIHKLLLKMKVAPSDIMPIIAARDLNSLKALLQPPEADPPPPENQSLPHEDHSTEDQTTESSPLPESPPSKSLDRETMKKAMKAFRKRMKLIRLDHESKLGYGPMTGGRSADFNAIMPPRKYPKVVWEALVEAGQLKRAGPGFYMLAIEPDGT